MSKPSLATIRYYQVHGKLPKKTKKQSSKKEEPEPKETPKWPRQVRDKNGKPAPWWELSNGKKLQDEEKAIKAQAELS